MALVQTLLAVCGYGAKELCITPSWTFVATPAAIHAAGLVPYFADVSPSKWALDPNRVEVLADRLRRSGHRVGAVMPVAPFGAPLDLAAWEAFQERTGIPVIIDAAAGFDCFTQTGKLQAILPPSRLPVVVSLHATKIFGIGEGAFVLTSDRDLAVRIRSWGNFGFHNTRQAKFAGLNTKMSEMSAAMGLALLDRWPEIRKEWVAHAECFRQHVRNQPYLLPVPVMDESWVSSYGLVRFADPSIDLSSLMLWMSSRNVETRRWWEDGCHLQQAYENSGHENMEGTHALAQTVLGLPLWRGLGADGLAQVFEVLAEAVAARNVKFIVEAK